MAEVSKIKCSENSGCYENDSASFLKEEDINSTAEKLERGKGIDSIYGSIDSEIENSGLSGEALLIEGRAPLYELAKELVQHMKSTEDDYNEVAEKQIKPLGNLHRQDEAEEYYDRAIEQYQKHLNNLNTAITNYNNNVSYTYEDSNGNKQTGYYSEINLVDDTSTFLPAEPTTEPTKSNDQSSNHDDYIKAVDEAYAKVKAYFEDPVTKAVKLKDECSGLKTKYTEIDVDTYLSADTSGSGITQGNEPTYNIDEAYKKYDENLKGKHTNYDNDGTTVVAVKNDDDSKTYYRYNKDGDLIEVHVIASDREEKYYTKDGVEGTKVNYPSGPVVPFREDKKTKVKGYDDDTALVTVKNDDDSRTYYRYNKDGDCVKVEEKAVNGDSHHYAIVDGERYEYTADDGKLEENKYPYGNSGDEVTSTTRSKNLFEIKDEKGNIIAEYNKETATITKKYTKK